MPEIHHIPLAQIQMDALPRDRSTLSPAALSELQSSIASEGLRQPIEVWRLSTPTEAHTYGLISGFCRLTAHHNLAKFRPEAYRTIPAFLRTPTDITAALSAMITENEVRAAISPWDKGRILVEVVREAHFETLDAATQALHPNATRQKRARLRACASVVEDLDGLLTTPEDMTVRQIERLASSLRGGFVDLIQQILAEHRGESLTSQWSALTATLNEADKGEEETPPTQSTPGRPRRMVSLPQGLVIRREVLPNGYALRFTGPEARRKGLMDDVMDAIERLFMPGS